MLHQNDIPRSHYQKRYGYRWKCWRVVLPVLFTGTFKKLHSCFFPFFLTTCMQWLFYLILVSAAVKTRIAPRAATKITFDSLLFSSITSITCLSLGQFKVCLVSDSFHNVCIVFAGEQCCCCYCCRLWFMGVTPLFELFTGLLSLHLNTG